MPVAVAPAIQEHMNSEKLGQAHNGALITNKKYLTMPCVDATVAVSAEGATVANQRDITITLRDSFGNAINYVETVRILMFTAQDRLAFASTGGSTGIAIGTNGALLTQVAKKSFVATSEANGLIDLTYTDTGTEAMAIAVYLPNGNVVMGSSLLTNA